MKEISTPLLVVAVALIENSTTVLMHRRPLGGEHGGLWEFPGGKVDAGETPECALVREVKEELGIHIEKEHLEPAAFATGAGVPGRPGEGIVILLYICRVWQGAPRCLFGEEIGWYAPGDLAMLEMPPLDYPLAAHLVAALESDSF